MARAAKTENLHNFFSLRLLLLGWGEEIAPGEEVLRGANIPNFPYPDTAARMFNYMWRYNDTLRAPYETPVLPGDAGSSLNRERARQILEAVRQEGRRDRRSLYRPGGRGRRAEGS